MDAAAALADLVEISPQIEAAAVVSDGGELVGSVGVPEARAGVLARAVRELLDGVAAFRSDQGRVTQLHAELAGGDVFAVAGAGERAIVAVTRPRAAPGLVFYDLKRCLAAVGDEA
jgi:predicted regulator of Ras-like GTPase activity (Roadblock/LC7/MglB family)